MGNSILTIMHVFFLVSKLSEVGYFRPFKFLDSVDIVSYLVVAYLKKVILNS